MKNLFAKIKDFFTENPVGSFVARYSITIGLFVLALILFGAGSAEMNTIFLIVAFETLAIVLSSLATFAYTKIRFTSDILSKKDDDSSFSASERAAMIRTLGQIVLAVHLMVGLCVWSLYLSQFAN